MLELIEHLSSVKLTEVEQMLEAAKSTEAQADALGLPLTGEEWESRLLIKAKGGGTHFDDATREAAGRASQRGACLHQAAGWHEQLRARTAQLKRATLRSDGVAKSVQLEKSRELLKASKRTVAEICEEGALRHAVAEMEKLRVPHALHAEAAAVSAAAAPLGAWAQELCLAELRSLQAEARMTQRFRAPGTLAVLRAGEQLLVDLQPFVPAAASAVPRLLNELRGAVAEVEPLCAATAASFDELDEEI